MFVLQYFKKYGFEDGDNSRLLREARRLRPRVVQLFNEEFRARNLPYRAVEDDVSTAHNPVRAEIVWQEDGKQWEWDYYYGLLREAPPGSVASMESMRMTTRYTDSWRKSRWLWKPG